MRTACPALCVMIVVWMVLTATAHADTYYVTATPAIQISCDLYSGLDPDVYTVLAWDGSITYTYTLSDTDTYTLATPPYTVEQRADQVKSSSLALSMPYCTFSLVPHNQFAQTLVAAATVTAYNEGFTQVYPCYQIGWIDAAVRPGPPNTYIGSNKDTALYTTKHFIVEAHP